MTSQEVLDTIRGLRGDVLVQRLDEIGNDPGWISSFQARLIELGGPAPADGEMDTFVALDAWAAIDPEHRADEVRRGFVAMFCIDLALQLEDGLADELIAHAVTGRRALDSCRVAMGKISASTRKRTEAN